MTTDATKSKLILVTGASGYLGQRVLSHLTGEFGKDNVIGGHHSKTMEQLNPAFNWQRIDLTDRKEVEQFIERFKPDVVVNTAAISNVRVCEENETMARSLNVPSFLINACKALEKTNENFRFIHVSTDQIFNGLEAPYTEHSALAPPTKYGEQKRDAEAELREKLEKSSICIRPSVIFGEENTGESVSPHAHQSFVQWLKGALAEAKEKERSNATVTPIECFNDLVSLIHSMIEIDSLPSQRIFNAGGIESLSRFELAAKVADVLGASRAHLNAKELTDEDRKQFAYPRPPDLSMNSELTVTTFNWRRTPTHLALEMSLK